MEYDPAGDLPYPTAAELTALVGIHNGLGAQRIVRDRMAYGNTEQFHSTFEVRRQGTLADR